MNITPKELTLLKAIHDSEHHDGESVVDHPVWTEDVCYHSGLGDGAGGVMASLSKKGLAKSDREYDPKGVGDASTCWITQAGMDAINVAERNNWEAELKHCTVGLIGDGVREIAADDVFSRLTFECRRVGKLAPSWSAFVDTINNVNGYQIFDRQATGYAVKLPRR